MSGLLAGLRTLGTGHGVQNKLKKSPKNQIKKPKNLTRENISSIASLVGLGLIIGNKGYRSWFFGPFSFWLPF